MRQRDRPRGRDWVWRDRRERENEIRKYDRERERAYKNGKNGLGERYNKIIKKIDYLNKRGDRIDELIWVFCKSDGVKQKKQVFGVKQTESFR